MPNTAANVVTKILENARKMKDDGYPVEAVPYYCEAAELLLQQAGITEAAECYEKVGHCYELDGRWSDAAEWYSKAKDTFTRAGEEARAKQAGNAAEYANDQKS